MPNRTFERGFTLLELSIVLVIIGLIIGGITVGQDLIRAAELNAIVNDINRYKTAMNTFRLKYGQLPGDFDNASSYWPADCVDDAAAPTSNCDGNGNGVIVYSGGEVGEHYRFWQHLALAEIIAGSYTGEATLSSNFVAGTQAPNAPLNGVYTVGATMAVPEYALLAQQRNMFSMGIPNNGSMMPLDPDALSPLNVVDTSSIDNKIDDGSAYKGTVLASGCNQYGDTLGGINGGEGTADYCEDNPPDCEYDYTSTDNCQIIFLTD